MESHGCGGFYRTAPDAIEIDVVGDPPPALQDAVQSLQGIGVAACGSDSSDESPCVLFGHTSTGGFVSPKGVNLVVEACLRENISKLRTAQADERHLFVWIDPSIGVAGVGIPSDCPPTVPPAIDPDVTAIWVGFPAPGGAEAGASRLWRATTAGWEDLGTQLIP